MNAVKKVMLRVPLIRFLALYRRESGALGQLGWRDAQLEKLLVSGSQAVPWFTYGAIDFADQTVSPAAKVLELGGGGSTKYWLQRGNHVTTVESSKEWVDTMSRELSTSFPNWKCMFIPHITFDSLSAIGDQKFDVIVNDFNGGNRGSVAEWMLEHLNHDGLIIWDNTDRANYQDGIGTLEDAGFGQVSFFGLGPVNSYASQTSFFSKKYNSPTWELLKRNSIPY